MASTSGPGDLRGDRMDSPGTDHSNELIAHGSHAAQRARTTALGVAALLVGLSACGKDPDANQDPSAPIGQATSGSGGDLDSDSIEIEFADGDAEMLATIDALTALGYGGDVETEGDDRRGVVSHDQQRSCPGYGLYTIPGMSRADLIDRDGTTVHHWSHPQPDASRPASLRWSRSILLENGDLLVVGIDETQWEESGHPRRAADDARYLMRLNWDGELLWKRQMRAHHDVEVTPSGNILTLTFKRRDAPKIHPSVPIRIDRLTLLDQDGVRLESRSLLPAVLKHPEIFPITTKAPDELGGDPWVDLFHANSCEWMKHAELVEVDPIYASDNVLVCFRHQHCIAIFNWTRKEVVWSWGKGKIWGPHDAQVMPDGKILLFDNGLGIGRSRAILLDPITKEIVWQWRADPPTDFYTEFRGSVQLLPNGNFLLSESDAGRAFEITSDGEVVWEFLCPHSPRPGRRAGISRMQLYAPELVDGLLAEHEH